MVPTTHNKYNMTDLLHEVYIQQQSKIQDTLTNNDYEKITDHWTGKVIENDDKLHLGRVKIRIVGFYNEIADAAIPWAMPESTYFGSSKGNFTVPPIGTIVRGYFDNGDDQKPIYTAIAPALSNYATSDLLTNPEEAFDYPNIVTLFNTDEGERATINRSNGEMHIVHRTGTTITITSTGEIRVETNSIKSKMANPGSTGINGVGVNLTIAGPVNLNADKDVTINAGKKSTINVNAPGGIINLGDNAADKEVNGVKVPSLTKQKVNNLPNCLFTGAPHCFPAALKKLNVYV